MYRKHPNHTYGRNRNNSANNRAIDYFLDQHDIVSCINAQNRKRGVSFFQIQAFDFMPGLLSPISHCGKKIGDI